jgi:predicted DNA-binding antitoxin AbrB/MazE fold protein
MILVRAIYHDGKFQPLDTVDLQDGQEVQLNIIEKQSSIEHLIEDMLTQFTQDDDDFDEDAIVKILDNAFKDKRPLSEIIIEERQEGR